MASHSKSTSSRAKVAAQARLRARGLRPVQIWVPDVRSPELKAGAEREARLTAMDPQESETTVLIDAVADWGGEE